MSTLAEEWQDTKKVVEVSRGHDNGSCEYEKALFVHGVAAGLICLNTALGALVSDGMILPVALGTMQEALLNDLKTLSTSKD